VIPSPYRFRTEADWLDALADRIDALAASLEVGNIIIRAKTRALRKRRS